MTRRLALVSLLTLVTLAPAAWADGDPASDYLLGQPAFLPPDLGIPPAYANQLTEVLRDVKARGYTIRVALIGSRYDMGSVTALYRKPKLYARFLGQELYFVYRGRLLVVMPNGFATSRGGKATPGDQAVVDRLPAPGKGGAALAAGASKAVTRLAANAGVIVPLPPLSGSTSGPNQNHDRLVLAGAAVVLLALGAAGTFVWRRLGRTS